jgi:hypothetical protein
MPPLHPDQAVRLLRDPRRLRYACDFRTNPAFSRQAATTKDWQGRILAEEVRPGMVEDTTAWLSRTVDALLANEHVELEPLRHGSVPKRTGGARDIWVMSYQRKALSNLIAGVLEDTTSHLLHAHVRAYIPGAREAVKNTVLDVAQAVAQGRVRKFINVDVRNCFDAITFDLVEASLRHFGFATEVANLVLASVRAPRWVGRPGGPGRLVTYDRGVPMGISESAVLANLAFFELDHELASIKDARAARYSDNIFVGAHDTQTAVRAARLCQRWARARGFQLKDIHPNASPRSLVRDVRNERIELLGTDIDCNGEVHMPLRVVREKLREIGMEMEATERHYACNGSVFSGQSRYAGGVGSNVMDFDDIRERVEAFLDNWAGLNEVEAQRFCEVVIKRHRGLLRATEQPAAVWVASLGTQPATRTKDVPGCLSLDGRDADVSASDSWPAVPSDQGDEGFGNEAFDSQRASDPCNLGNRMAIDVHPSVPDGSVGITIASLVEACEVEICDHPDQWKDVLPKSVHPIRVMSTQVEELPQVGSRERMPFGMEARSETVNPSDVPNPVNYVRIQTRWIAGAPSPGTRVTISHSSIPSHAVTLLYPRARSEVVLLRAIRRVVELAAIRGEREVTIHCPAWLPKHLLSVHRRFRAPTLFSEVLQLHRQIAARSLGVILVGERTELARR